MNDRTFPVASLDHFNPIQVYAADVAGGVVEQPTFRFFVNDANFQLMRYMISQTSLVKDGGYAMPF